jgi:hypothetical protein
MLDKCHRENVANWEVERQVDEMRREHLFGAPLRGDAKRIERWVPGPYLYLLQKLRPGSHRWPTPSSAQWGTEE